MRSTAPISQQRVTVALTLAVSLVWSIIAPCVPEARANTFAGEPGATTTLAAGLAYVVTKTADTNDGTCNADCSLREAITATNVDGGADTVTFDIPTTDAGYDAGTGRYTITLNALGALPDVSTDMTIQGLGANALTVRRDSAATARFRIFTVASGARVTISGMTISGGFTGNGVDGGGVFNNGILTINDSVINSNQTGSGSSSGFGSGGSGGSGGGVFNANSLTINNSTVSGNQTGGGGGGFSGGSGGNGGGIFNASTLNINNSTLSNNNTGGGASGDLGRGGNSGDGGGIYNSGILTITNSTLSGNQTSNGVTGGIGSGGSGGNGGGIFSSSTLNITNSTFNGNQTGGGGGGFRGGSGGNGGGIFSSSTLNITNSTFNGNQTGGGGSGSLGSLGSGGSGGGVFCSGGLTINNSTVSGNQTGSGGGGSGGGINTSGSDTHTVGSTIIALNSVASGGNGPDASGTFTSRGYNLVGKRDASTGFTATADQTGTAAAPLDPQLAPLASNGGPTQTRALLVGSPVFDKGKNFAINSSGTPILTDQRGATRPIDNPNVPNATGGDGSDIGAYEIPVLPLAPTMDLQAASDTGISNADNITSDNTPTFDISGGSALYIIQLLRNGVVVASRLMPGFTDTVALTDATAPADGAYSYTTRQVSQSNVSSADSAALPVTIDTHGPNVTINQAAGQADPTSASIINFTVVFSEPTTNFTTGDVTLSGTAGATTATVTGSGTTYNVAVTGMTQSGTVTASVAAGVATDTAGNANLASTSTDNTVTINVNATASISINDVSQAEGNTGTTTFTFTVSLDSPAPASGVSVQYATSDGTATGGAACTAGVDYKTASGTVSFAGGDTQKPIAIEVCGDTTPELAETFLVNFSMPVNASLGDSQGAGNIENDDAVASAGQLIISEFRLRGPGPSPSPEPTPEANDEFIELYNATDAPLLVTTTDGSAGFAVAASDGAARCTISNGTVIPARGHFLCANSNGYSLSTYAAPDAVYTTGLADDAGIALFRTATPANFNATTRLDAAGFSVVADTLYREGAGIAGYPSTDGEYSFMRKLASGVPQDTGDNNIDFTFVAAPGAVAFGPNSTVAQRGAPGPENLAGPLQRNASLKASLVDPTQPSTASPNRVRDATSGGAGTATAYGTLDIRRRFRNSTGLPISALRFRIVDVTTQGSPGAGSQADLRLISSVTTTANAGTIIIEGTTLEAPSDATGGGGLNSSVAVTLPGGGLASGASINVRFLLGVAQNGSFRFFVNAEAVTTTAVSASKSGAKARAR